MTPLHPRIYVASLSDYNAGRLHGVWIDLADPDLDDVVAKVDAMLATSREPHAEEYAIHDYEGFGPARIDEYENVETVVQIAEGIRDHGEAFAAWVSLWHSRDFDELERFDELYVGSFDSMREYAEELLDGLGIDTDPDRWAPEVLAPFVRVDLDAFARSLTDMYSVVEGDTQVHVFEP